MRLLPLLLTITPLGFITVEHYFIKNDEYRGKAGVFAIDMFVTRQWACSFAWLMLCAITISSSLFVGNSAGSQWSQINHLSCIYHYFQKPCSLICSLSCLCTIDFLRNHVQSMENIKAYGYHLLANRWALKMTIFKCLVARTVFTFKICL